MDASIAVARDGAIATVVLNRPDKLNALTKSMWHDLGTAIGALSAVDDLRCIIVRGAGEKAFSPGNDIGEFATERANKRQAIGYGEVMRATAEALPGWRVETGAQSAVFSPATETGVRLPPGEERAIGWLRLDPAVPFHAQTVP